VSNKKIDVQSHKGVYTVNFIRGGMDQLNSNPIENAIYIFDKKIATIYRQQFKSILDTQRVILIEAKEENKSLDKFSNYVGNLVDYKLRRGQTLIAIGGGIIQDITCFLAATVMRGLPWIFIPTTLLAQSDSCIGSKSSINCGDLKNILGTFTPPNKIIIDAKFLQTLEQKDIHSGIGEMLKVHAINSPKSFDLISGHYDKIISDTSEMERFTHQSLLMKKKIIEIDEFDTGQRKVMNYGHSFGHAIEAATNFVVPHGIAVTIGMDIANFVAAKLNVSNLGHFDRMHDVLSKNSKLYKHYKPNIQLFMDSLSKDKKNTRTQLTLILPDQNGCIEIGLYDNNRKFRKIINQYFNLFYKT